jgi:hypothetical protein
MPIWAAVGRWCSLDFGPWLLKGIGRLHYFEIFVYIANSFDFKSDLKFKKFPFAQ